MFVTNYLSGFNTSELYTLYFDTYTQNNTDDTVGIPSDCSTQDFGLIISLAVNSSTSPTDSTPSGWSKIATDILSDGFIQTRSSVYAKLLSSADSSTTVSNLLVGAFGQGHNFYRFRGNYPLKSFTAYGDYFSISNGTPTSRSTLATGKTSPVLSIGFAFTSTASPSPSFQFSATDGGYWRGHSIWNLGQTPTSITLSGSDGGDRNMLFAASFEIR